MVHWEAQGYRFELWQRCVLPYVRNCGIFFFRPFAIILPKARFSHFEDVSGVMIPQDKVRKLVSSGMVAHEFLHTGQNLITEGIKINLCLDQHGGHLVILPR